LLAAASSAGPGAVSVSAAHAAREAVRPITSARTHARFIAVTISAPAARVSESGLDALLDRNVNERSKFPDGDGGVRASIASASKHREARLRRAGIDGKRVGPREG